MLYFLNISLYNDRQGDEIISIIKDRQKERKVLVGLSFKIN